MSVPQREFGRLNKFFADIFKNFLSFPRKISEYFNIPELLYAECTEDLLWFEDKKRAYINDPNHFFVLLTYTVLVAKKFLFCDKLLCKYFARVYKTFNLDLYFSYGYGRVGVVVTFQVKLSKYLHEMRYYDLLVSFILNDPSLFSNISMYLNDDLALGFHFYKELISDPLDGLSNFFKLYNLQQTNFDKSLMLSGILGTDKSLEILFECLNNLNSSEAKFNLFQESYIHFFKYIKSYLNLKVEDWNKIYERNLTIISVLSAQNFELNNFKISN